jgi:hypothetical protein
MEKRLLPLAAGLLIAAGCGATVRASVTPGANLEQYHSYAFFTPTYRANQPESPAEQEVRSALRRDLALKGMVEATSAPADFLVAYHVKERQVLDVGSVGYGFWGYGYGPGYVTSYTEGTLIVDFIDPRTKSVFWRGTATAVVSHPDTPNLAKVDKAVSKLVGQYPSMTASIERPQM